MESINARAAKNRFAEVLRMASTAPVEITNHGRPVAYISSVAPVAPESSRVELMVARMQKLEKDMARRQRHFRYFSALDPHEEESAVARATQLLAQWEGSAACSADYIRYWQDVITDPRGLLRAFAGLDERWSLALCTQSPFLLGGLMRGHA